MKPRLILCLIIVAILVSGCSAWENAYEQAGSSSFTVISIKGTGALSLIKAMAPEIKPMVRLGDTVQYTFEEDENVIYEKLLKGEFDIAVVPTEMAAKLYNNGSRYRLAAVNTGGFLYILAKGKTITELSEMKGEKVKVIGENSVADIVLKYLLMQNYIDPSRDITLEYAASEKDLEQDILNGKNNLMVLSEPWVSDLLNKNSELKIASDIQDEWALANVDETLLPLSCLIVKSEIVSQKTESWNLFIKDYKDSIKWVNSNQSKTYELLENHDVGISKDMGDMVISRSNLEYVDALSAKSAVDKYLSIYLELSPESIGGKLPGADFYIEK